MLLCDWRSSRGNQEEITKAYSSARQLYFEKFLRNGLYTFRYDNDTPVIVSAIVSDVDILITGDKDFAELSIERPEILIPSEFLNRY